MQNLFHLNPTRFHKIVISLPSKFWTPEYCQMLADAQAHKNNLIRQICQQKQNVGESGIPKSN
jgi:hypothetical protein